MAPIHLFCNQVQHAFTKNFRYTAVPDNNTYRQMASILMQHGFINKYELGTEQGPLTHFIKSPANVARSKIWLQLKYRLGQPVLRKFACVSLPSRKVYASVDELRGVAMARKSNSLLKGSVLGQITFVETPYGILELGEAIEKRVGGKVLAYAF